MITLAGRITRTIRRKTYSEWGVADLVVPGEPGVISIVGRLGTVDIGLEVIVHGDWATHPTYGKQFKVEDLVVDVPSNPLAVEKWLLSIGEVPRTIVQRLVSAYGRAVFEIVTEQPMVVAEAHKIDLKVVQELRVRIMAAVSTKEFYLRGFELELTASEIKKLWKTFGDTVSGAEPEDRRELTSEIYRDIVSDPWDLCIEHGFGFARTATLCKKWGYKKQTWKRSGSAVLEALRRAVRQGHCGLHIEDAAADAEGLLHEVEPSLTVARAEFADAARRLDSVLVYDNVLVPFALDQAERRIAHQIRRLGVQQRILDAADTQAGGGS